MPYRELLDRLERVLSLDGSVVSLPDGSVDTYYRVFEGRRTPVDSRRRFADFLGDGRTGSVRVERESREADGQVVNLAGRVDYGLGVSMITGTTLGIEVGERSPFARRNWAWSAG